MSLVRTSIKRVRFKWFDRDRRSFAQVESCWRQSDRRSFGRQGSLRSGRRGEHSELHRAQKQGSAE